MLDVQLLRQEILDKMIDFPYLKDFEKRIYALFYKEANSFHDEVFASSLVDEDFAPSNGTLYLTGEDKAVIGEQVESILDELKVQYDLDIFNINPSENTLLVFNVNAKKVNVAERLDEIKDFNFPKIICIAHLDYATNDTMLWVYENVAKMGKDTIVLLEASDATEGSIIMGLDQMDVSY